MAIFCPKKLAIALPVSETFKRARAEQGLDLDTLACRTRLPKKYLIAIEEGHFEELPKSKAFKIAYVKEYAEALGLDAAPIGHQFEKETKLDDNEPALPKPFIKIWPVNSITLLVRNLALILLAVIFVGYLGWQVNGILQPPKLEVYNPVEGYVTAEPTTLVQGNTEKEAWLLINGQETTPNDAGHFEIPVDLLNGVNTITVSAIKRHGKTTTVVRHIVVRQNGAREQKISKN